MAQDYRARLRAARQRDNEAWDASAKVLTDRHQGAMSAAIAKAYRITWPREPYLVDVAAIGGRITTLIEEEANGATRTAD